MKRTFHSRTGLRSGLWRSRIYDALALEEIARTAVHRQIGVTVREYADVLALADLAGVLARADQAPPASEFVRELAAHG